MKTHIVVFHDGSKLELTKDFADGLANAISKGDDKVMIEDAIISLKAISKVLTIAEHNKEYPKDQRQAEQRPNLFSAPPQKELTIEQQALKRERNYRKLLGGMLGYIQHARDNGENPTKAIQMYKDKLKIYKKTFKDNAHDIVPIITSVLDKKQ